MTQSQESNGQSPTDGQASSSLTSEETAWLRGIVAKRRMLGMLRPNGEPQGLDEIFLRMLNPSPTPLLAALSRSERQQALWARANIPDRHRINARDESGAPHEWKRRRDFLFSRIGQGLLVGLIGNRGTGKTQLAVSLGIASIAVERSVLYVKAMDIFLWLRHNMADGESSQLSAMNQFLAPDLLIIDELGERGETDFEDRMLVYICDKRYDRASKDTVLIANMTPEVFRESVGPSISDRLVECGGLISCEWPSIRRNPIVPDGDRIEVAMVKAANEPDRPQETDDGADAGHGQRRAVRFGRYGICD